MLLLGFLLNNLFTNDVTGNISGSTGSTTLTTQQIASHSHTLAAATAATCGSQLRMEVTGGTLTPSTGSTGGGQSHDHTLSANFVGGSASILQPYLVLIYIIKT